MPRLKIEVSYLWNGQLRSCIVLLPIRHAENAYAWLTVHKPGLIVLDTRRAGPLR